MHDVIIIGARCAGATTGMLLARKGYRVLIVDRATFPSDTMSTHWLHEPAVAKLRGRGLLDAVSRPGARRSSGCASTWAPSPCAGRRSNPPGCPPWHRGGSCSTTCWFRRRAGPGRRCGRASGCTN